MAAQRAGENTSTTRSAPGVGLLNHAPAPGYLGGSHDRGFWAELGQWRTWAGLQAQGSIEQAFPLWGAHQRFQDLGDGRDGTDGGLACTPTEVVW